MEQYLPDDQALAAIAVPVLLAVGEDSHGPITEIAQRLGARLGTDVTATPGGHCAYHDCPRSLPRPSGHSCAKSARRSRSSSSGGCRSRVLAEREALALTRLRCPAPRSGGSTRSTVHQRPSILTCWPTAVDRRSRPTIPCGNGGRARRTAQADSAPSTGGAGVDGGGPPSVCGWAQHRADLGCGSGSLRGHRGEVVQELSQAPRAACASAQRARGGARAGVSRGLR